MEALPAEVQVVLPDGKRSKDIIKPILLFGATSSAIPDKTMAIAASLALARSSSKLARPGIPNIVVTHPGGRSSLAHTLKPRLSVKVALASTSVKT